MKKINIFPLLLVVLFFNFTTTYAQPITPFKPFEWNDNFIDIFNKLKNNNTIKEIQIIGVDELERENAKNKSKTELEKRIKETITRYSKGYMFKEYNKEFIMKDGSKSHFYRREVAITASPINIAGIPCEIAFTFKNMPGYSLINPQKSILFKINGKEVAFIPQLERVTISSTDRSLATQNQQKLYEILKNKYPTLSDINSGSGNPRPWSGKYDYQTYGVKDGEYSIEIDTSPGSPRIRYKNSLKTSVESYKNHRNKVLSNNMESSDSSGGL